MFFVFFVVPIPLCWRIGCPKLGSNGLILLPPIFLSENPEAQRDLPCLVPLWIEMRTVVVGTSLFSGAGTGRADLDSPGNERIHRRRALEVASHLSQRICFALLARYRTQRPLTRGRDT